MIDIKQLNFDFVSLLTNNGDYLNQCVIDRSYLIEPYDKYFDLLKEMFDRDKSFDVIRIEQEGFVELYKECLFNGIAIDIKDAFKSYQRQLIEEYRKNKVLNLFQKWTLELIDTDKLLFNLTNLEGTSVNDLKDLTADDIMQSLMRKDKRLDFNKFLVLKDSLKLEQHDLLTIAGGTGSGKSSMALNLMEDLSLKYPCLYFNMEMSEDQINERLIAIHAKENLKALDNFEKMDESFKKEIRFRANNLTKDRHIKIVSESQKLENIVSIVASHDQEKHFIVFIDHVGLISVRDAKNNVEKITEVYQTLRKLSLDYNCTLIVLCQLNRESTKQSPRPTLSALKDSSEAEQSSSKVCFIFEQDDSYYFDIAKNRNGSNELLGMNYNKQTQVMEIYKGGARE